MALLTLNGTASNGGFGCSVSMTDSNAIVGAQNVENNDGAAYIYGKDSDGIWSSTALLTLNGTGSKGYFGGSVSMTDSYAIVGAPTADNNGVAYIYGKGSDGSWSGTALLTLSGEASDGNFGYSVSMTDSYALVGAIGADNNLSLIHI